MCIAHHPKTFEQQQGVLTEFSDLAGRDASSEDHVQAWTEGNDSFRRTFPLVKLCCVLDICTMPSSVTHREFHQSLKLFAMQVPENTAHIFTFATPR